MVTVMCMSDSSSSMHHQQQCLVEPVLLFCGEPCVFLFVLLFQRESSNGRGRKDMMRGPATFPGGEEVFQHGLSG